MWLDPPWFTQLLPEKKYLAFVLYSFSKGTLNILQLSNCLHLPGISNEPIATMISNDTVSIPLFNFKVLLQPVSCSRELLKLDQQACTDEWPERTWAEGRASPRFAPTLLFLKAISLPWLYGWRLCRRLKQACGLTERWATKSRVSTLDLGSIWRKLP